MNDTYTVTETDNFEVGINNNGESGYFEHNRLGDELAGGLWFEGNKLYDYDGVYKLPAEVQDELINRGVDVSYVYTDEDI